MVQLGVFRVQLQAFLILGDGFFCSSLAQKDVSEIAISPEVVRINLQRRRKMGKGLIGLAFGQKSVSKIVMGHGAVGGNC